MIERILFSIDFENAFILISLNILNIEVEENSDIDELKNFNVGVQIYLAFEEEHEEFIVIGINLNIVKRDNKEYPYNKDDLYLESNNVRYYSIIQINYIHNYCTFHLKFKTINNFFLRTIFKFIRKIYKEEKTRHWILTIKITIYRTFIPSFKYPPIYIKKEVILE